MAASTCMQSMRAQAVGGLGASLPQNHTRDIFCSAKPFKTSAAHSLKQHHERWVRNGVSARGLKSEKLIGLSGKRMRRKQGLGQHGRTRKGGISCVVTEAPTDLNLDTAFGSIELVGLDGTRKGVTELWKDRKVVATWARHFGCVLCRKHAALLAERKADFDAAGVPLIIIGPGSESQAKTFQEETGFPGEVYADPTHDSFQALGFASGIWSTVNLQGGLNVVNALKEGYRQNWALSNEEDTRKRGGWQQGGTLIIGPGSDSLQYLRKDRWAGDYPQIKELLQTLRK